jgi:hypothetical protein
LTSSGKTWFECRDICVGMGAKLACPRSAAENSQAWAVAGTDAWLAVNDQASEGSYVCEGSSISYTNWNSGEPNDSGGAEECAHFSTSGFWNDHQCSYYLIACMCENN